MQSGSHLAREPPVVGDLVVSRDGETGVFVPVLSGPVVAVAIAISSVGTDVSVARVGVSHRGGGEARDQNKS